jgi:hypothetical protein
MTILTRATFSCVNGALTRAPGKQFSTLLFTDIVGSVFGNMPELNVLCAIADHSEQSGQPLTKQLIVEVSSAVTGRAT